MRRVFLKYLNPWGFRRDEEARRVAELRSRDGDACRRCRRPIRFDLAPGHELGAKVDQILPKSAGGAEALDNLCLTHGRCNARSGDHTDEVRERLRPKREAELFAKARKPRRAA